MDGSQSTQPADIRRKRFTAADVQAMLEAGVLKDGEKVELVGGELVEMSPQGPLHWDVTYELGKWLRKNLPANVGIASKGPFRLGKYNEPEPEFIVLPDDIRINDARGPDALLVVEVALTSARYDLKVKAPIYAAHGVREYWVIDVKKRRTVVHRLGKDGAYTKLDEVAFDAPLKAPGGKRLIIADLAPKA